MTHDRQHHDQRPDFGQLREELAELKGRTYWRSLENLAATDGFIDYLRNEFPQGVSEWLDPISRRKFLKLMGASLALAGVVGCTRQPDEQILPYANRPEGITIGVPQYYTTAMTLGGYAFGLLVESYQGRPTKIEGNPDHPASLGATTIQAQASLLTLYDPDRSQTVNTFGEEASWDDFTAALSTALENTDAARVRLLTGNISSPSLASQITTFLEDNDGVQWHQWDTLARDNARQGAVLAFGEPVETRYDLTEVDVILTIDSNLLLMDPGSVRYAHDYAPGRRVWENDDELSRHYAIESSPTATGSMADHRLRLRPSAVEGITRAIAQQMGLEVEQTEGFSLSESQQTWVGGLISDLQASAGRSVVVVGDEQPPALHAIAHAMNEMLGNVGSTVFYSDLVIYSPDNDNQSQLDSLRELITAMREGEVDVLVILGSNPAFTTPVDLGFAAALEQVPFSMHSDIYANETAALCTWHVPETHYLESWGDARAFDGTTSIVQPLIAPLYAGRSQHQIMAALSGETERAGYDIVRAYWAESEAASQFRSFDTFWQNVLNVGVIPDSNLPLRDDLSASLADLPAPAIMGQGLEMVFRLDPNVLDGQFANNGWLQELPRPLTKMTWDNPVLISPRTAVELLGLNISEFNPAAYEELSEANGRIVDVEYNGRILSMPLWILPGHADDTITAHLGFGHTSAGAVGNEVGFNTYTLRTSENLWSGPVIVRPTLRIYQLASTQDHHSMEGRGIVRAGSLELYREQPDFVRFMDEFEPDEEKSLFGDAFSYDEQAYSWGMSMDLNTCIGCNACVVACQAENNIPIVGKDEVLIGREMHWLRIDRYYGGSLEDPQLYRQQMACVHCELAPCEIVCPVNATVHGPEGLNQMIYNRCVGTKYCSNNCPYKVRRFNFLSYTNYIEEAPTLQLMQNPEVTVRSRGVMEKCTYCIQRIKEVTTPARATDRVVADGEIVTACQQACPTGAIVFGNLNDPGSRVNELKQLPLAYTVLGGFNFVPRTSHIGRLTNPNLAIGETPGEDYIFSAEGHGGGHGEDETHDEGAEESPDANADEPHGE